MRLTVEERVLRSTFKLNTLYKSLAKPQFKPVVYIYDTDQPLLAEVFVVCLRRGYLFL
jgi:hypothetical protein